MNTARTLLQRAGRALLLMLCVAAGTVLLVRFAPGYFSDTREIDAKYAQTARTEISAEQAQDGSAGTIGLRQFRELLHGDLGQSRQYQVPVTELIAPRLSVSGLLLLRGILYGWLLACCLALPVSAMRRGGQWVSAPFTLLLAVPTAAMATACIVAETGGPVLVLTLLIAARDFKFAHRLLSGAWTAPHLLHARAQGVALPALIRGHILPNILPQFIAVARLSLVTSLGLIVPIEVLFNLPGVGQLAWSAVMNRDLPVMLAVTLLMTVIVASTGMFSQRVNELEAA